jgi:hypothetical protein
LFAGTQTRIFSVDSREATAPIYEALVAEHGDVPGQVREAAAEVEQEEHDVLDFSDLLPQDGEAPHEEEVGEAAGDESEVSGP